ncbi:MAG: YpoC family protein [Lysinibacillus sp.]
MIEVNQEAISKEIIDKWFNEWEAVSEQLNEAHTARDKVLSLELMMKGIAMYDKLLLDSAVSEAQVDNEFELYPINGRERMQFIKARPAQFASYRQLDELYKETKKRVARLRLKK